MSPGWVGEDRATLGSFALQRFRGLVVDLLHFGHDGVEPGPELVESLCVWQRLDVRGEAFDTERRQRLALFLAEVLKSATTSSLYASLTAAVPSLASPKLAA